jgi:hypothetical protein
MSDWGWFGGVQAAADAGANTAASAGTTVTAPGSNNTKGAWTQLLSSAPFDVGGILFGGYFTHTSGLQHALVDIGIGASSSEQVLIPDVAWQRQSSSGKPSPATLFPCRIPAGTRIAARYQSSTASGSTLAASATLLPAGGAYPIRSGKAVVLGANTTTSRGLQVDPGGTVNTKGSYAELTSSHAHASQWAVLSAMNEDSGGAAPSWLVDLAIGGAGSEIVVIPNLLIAGFQDVEASGGIHRIFIPLALQAGVRIAARAQCNVNGAQGRLLALTLHTFS